VNSGITDKNKLFMKKFVEDKNQTIEFIQVNPEVITKGKNFDQKPIYTYRILIPTLLPDNVDRVLYLDSDTLVLSDLKYIYNIDLHGKAVGMCVNIGNFTINHLKIYHNSGVILIDVKKWNNEKLTDKLLSYMHNNIKKYLYNEDKKKLFKYPDQDLINIVLSDNIRTINLCYNYQTTHKVLSFCNVGIKHFVGYIKPWHFPRTDNNAFELYYKNWNNSPLRIYKYYYILKSTKSMYINNLLNIQKYLVKKTTNSFKEKN